MKIAMGMTALAVMLAAGGLAGCSQGGPKLSEEAMAEKIVEADGVIALDKETMENVIGMNLQGVAAQHPGWTPEQQVKLSTTLRAEMDKGVPELKKRMAGFLVETLDEKELKLIYDYATAMEAKAIRGKLTSVTQMSIAAADAMTIQAVDEAMKAEGLKGDTAPGVGHGAPPGTAATPEPAKPVKPN